MLHNTLYHTVPTYTCYKSKCTRIIIWRPIRKCLQYNLSYCHWMLGLRCLSSIWSFIGGLVWALSYDRVVAFSPALPYISPPHLQKPTFLVSQFRSAIYISSLTFTSSEYQYLLAIFRMGDVPSRVSTDGSVDGSAISSSSANLKP